MPHRHLPPVVWLTFTLVTTLSVGCSSDQSSSGDPSCDADESYNRISGECEPTVPSRPDEDTGVDTVDSDTGTVDTRTEPRDTSSRDTYTPSPDTSPDEDTRRSTDTGQADTMTCDQDRDMVRDKRCGGPDCEGNDPAVRPDAPELCDGKDNNCNDEVDEGLDCTFYAHGKTKLYRIDPFAKSVTRQNASNAPSRDFLDMDTHPDGDLYAITSSALYRLPESGSEWKQVTSLSGTLSNINGMAISRRGTGYLTGGNTLYKLALDETSGSPSPTTVGQFGGSYTSSGDCVINKKGTLLMTSRNPLGPGDTLVEIDQRTGKATKIGVTDHKQIWGLTAAWSKLYGTTSNGELIVIDETDGSSKAVDTFSDKSFYGAASTPASRRRPNNK